MKQVNPIWNLDKDAKKNVTGKKKHLQCLLSVFRCPNSN